MNEKPENQKPVEGDPERGDAILRRMLKTPPKQHKDMKKSASKRTAKVTGKTDNQNG